MLSPNAKNFVPTKDLEGGSQTAIKSSLSPFVEEFVPSAKAQKKPTEERLQWVQKGKQDGLQQHRQGSTPAVNPEIEGRTAVHGKERAEELCSEKKTRQVINEKECIQTAGKSKQEKQKGFHPQNVANTERNYKQRWDCLKAKECIHHHHPSIEGNWRERSTKNTSEALKKDPSSQKDPVLGQESFTIDGMVKEHGYSNKCFEKENKNYFGSSRGRGRGRAWGSGISRDIKESINRTVGVNRLGEKKDSLQDVSGSGTFRRGRGRGAWGKEFRNKQHGTTNEDLTVITITDDLNPADGTHSEEKDGWTVVGNKKKGSEVRGVTEQAGTMEVLTQHDRRKPFLQKGLSDENRKFSANRKGKGYLNSPQLDRKGLPRVKRDAWVQPKDKDETRIDISRTKLSADSNEEIGNAKHKSVHGRDQKTLNTERIGIEQPNVSETSSKSVAVRTSKNNATEKTRIERTNEKLGIEPQPVIRLVTAIQFDGKNPGVKQILKKDNYTSLWDVIQSAEPKSEEPVFEKEEFPDLESNKPKSSEQQMTLTYDWLSGGSRMPILSYSAALKTKPQPKQLVDSTKRPVGPSQKAAAAAEENETQGKKKKKRKKKNKGSEGVSAPVHQNTSPKKTKEPMQFDLGQILASVQLKDRKDKQTLKKKAVVAGVLPTQLSATSSSAGQFKADTAGAKPGFSAKGFHNTLDSTAPVVKRGKEREVPKKKKPSAMKRVILKEREEKKKGREQPVGDKTYVDLTTISGGMEDTPVKETEHTEVTAENRDEISTPSLPTEDDIRAEIHSRRFREYCDQVLDKELNNITCKLLSELVRFQDRVYFKDPEKAKYKKRFVVGLREVTKHLKLKKVKCVILSPNVERIQSAGGLDDALHTIISLAHANEIPVVFSLHRQVLGKAVCKKVPVSAVGIFNYDGAQDLFKTLMELTENGRRVYAERWNAAQEALREKLRSKKDAMISLVSADEEDSGEPQEDVMTSLVSADEEDLGELQENVMTSLVSADEEDLGEPQEDVMTSLVSADEEDLGEPQEDVMTSLVSADEERSGEPQEDLMT